MKSASEIALKLTTQSDLLSLFEEVAAELPPNVVALAEHMLTVVRPCALEDDFDPNVPEPEDAETHAEWFDRMRELFCLDDAEPSWSVTVGQQEFASLLLSHASYLEGFDPEHPEQLRQELPEGPETEPLLHDEDYQSPEEADEADAEEAASRRRQVGQQLIDAARGR